MNVAYTDELFRTLKELKRKDQTLFRRVQKKIGQIASLDGTAVGHFKNLRGELSDLKRVHVGCFVLTFDVKGDIITFRNEDKGRGPG